MNALGSRLSGMRTKAVLEIKTGSSDSRILNSPKTQVGHIPTVSPLLLGPTVRMPCSDKQEVKNVAHFALRHNLDSYMTFFLSITCCLSSPVFDPICLCVCCHRQSERSHKVTCTCQSCIVRIQHIPLAWQIWFT